MTVIIHQDLIITSSLNPHISKLEDAYRLCCDYHIDVSFTTDIGLQNTSIIVPEDFETDGASIPSAAWQLVGTPFNPRIMRAAVAHDWLYYTHQVTQQEADLVFKEIMDFCNIRGTRNLLIYGAVNAFGHHYWPNSTNDVQYLNIMKQNIAHRHQNPQLYGL